MRQTLDAVFENGTFKPVDPRSLDLSPGQRVRLIVETPIEDYEDVIKLASEVYEGLSDQQVNEIEKIALDRNSFFGDRTV